MNRKSKVMIIGLDGGTFDLIQPWVDQGKLPNIARLMQSGTYNTLKTTIPPMTFPAWNAFMTGKNPGKHGVFDFMERKQGTYELDIMNALHRKCDSLWKIAGRYGNRCAVIGVPVTYPPEEINGVLISGFDAPFFDERIMYPRELFQELKENVGEYIVTGSFTKHLKTGDISAAVEEMFIAIDRKAATAQYIFRREPWDLSMIVFGETDAAIHHFWKYHDKNSPQRNSTQPMDSGFDPVYEIYARVDKHIGDLMEIVTDDTTVIMMSDHGVGGVSDKIIYLNRFLEAHGLLKFKNLSLLINKTLDKVKARVRFLLPEKIAKDLLFNPKNMGLKWEAKLRYSYIDWAHTSVYAEETPHYPSVRVNLRGREPDGIVDKNVYNDIVDRLIALLGEWKDPETGAKVVQKAYRKEEVYHGDYLGNAPDVLISWNYDRGYSYLSRPSFVSRGKLPLEKMSLREIETSAFMFNRSGSHRDNGIFVISGKKVRRGACKDCETEIVDLAPTILYLLDIPIPGDMDGKVLLDCFDKDTMNAPEYKTPHLPASGSDYHYTDEETEGIKKKLSDLGYL